tara:strand:- start:32732 stop:33247 length:516 start_codon:yes stop_codon:yes gene_type:complete
MAEYFRTSLFKIIQMMEQSVLKIIPLLVILLFSAQSFAAIDVYDFDDEEKRVDFVALTKELRCPKCQNQDIADSNAPIAADMRKEVHRLLKEGKDKESIVAYMIDRFGEFVTYKPKKTSETYMLWYGPWILIFVGIIVILSLARLNKKEVDRLKPSPEEVKSLLAKYEDKK